MMKLRWRPVTNRCWNFLASPNSLVAGENCKERRSIMHIGILDDLLLKMTQKIQLKIFLACMCRMRQL
jgi:hypothetical protein